LSVVQMLGQQAKDKGVELIVPPLAELPSRVTGDASRLRQVIVNLVNNAIKFTEAGHVVVSVNCTERDSEHVLVRCEVKDSGIGIEADALQRLFQAFSQADPTITKRFGGTGLGLSIARRLVKLMGGDIGVTSTVGVGSTFWFEITLERASSRPTSAPRDLRTDEHERLYGLRALVVDDSELNQEIVRRILEGQGATVTYCFDGASAVELLKAQQQEFDVVLMDVQMPVLDGNEATRQIRRLGLTALPIIGLTASALLADRDHSLKAGMNDLIGKPFDRETLARKLRLLVRAEAKLPVGH